MTDNQEEAKAITDPKLLEEMEELWAKWIEFEKADLAAMHQLIAFGKGIIQNPHVCTVQEIKDYLKTSYEQRDEVHKNSQARFNELLKKTVNLATKSIKSH